MLLSCDVLSQSLLHNVTIAKFSSLAMRAFPNNETRGKESKEKKANKESKAPECTPNPVLSQWMNRIYSAQHSVYGAVMRICSLSLQEGKHGRQVFPKRGTHKFLKFKNYSIQILHFIRAT